MAWWDGVGVKDPERRRVWPPLTSLLVGAALFVSAIVWSTLTVYSVDSPPVSCGTVLQGILRTRRPLSDQLNCSGPLAWRTYTFFPWLTLGLVLTVASLVILVVRFRRRRRDRRYRATRRRQQGAGAPVPPWPPVPAFTAHELGGGAEPAFSVYEPAVWAELRRFGEQPEREGEA